MKKKIAEVLVLLGVTVFCIFSTGCGKNTDTGKVTDGITQKSDVAKGRYVDEDITVIPEGYANTGRIIKLSDGSFKILSSLGIATSNDYGKSWEVNSTDDLLDLVDANYLLDFSCSSDNTTCVTYNPQSIGDGYQPETILIKPDGSIVKVETLPILYGDMNSYFSATIFTEDGRLFGIPMGLEVIYEIDPVTGKLSKYIEGESAYNIYSRNSLMAVCFEDRVDVYDLRSDTVIEDSVLDDFVSKEFGTFERWGPSSTNKYVFFGDDNTIYLASEKGIYRHVLQGEVVEQVVDGRLSSLSDPEFSYFDFIVDKDERGYTFFMAFTSQGKILRIAFDENLQSFPSQKLTVYGLYSNSIVKQTISDFMKDNPDIFVEYEIGIQSESMTVEDALKNLNTRILDNNAPDIYVLDSMPIDKYIEKGLFMDISEMMESINKQTPLHYNLIEPFYTDNKLFCSPAEVKFPIIVSDKNIDATNLNTLLNSLEELRKSNPNKSLFDIPSARGILKVLLPACYPSWFNDEGTLNKTNVSEYFEIAKKLYELELAGTPQNKIDEFNEKNEMFKEEYGYSFIDYSDYITTDILEYIYDDTVIGFDNIYNDFNLFGYYSLKYTDLKTETKMTTMSGQCQNPYYACSIIGVSSSVKENGNLDNVSKFIKQLYSDETQAKASYAMPVNKNAILKKIDSYGFEEGLEISERIMGSTSTLDEFGNYRELLIYLPDSSELENYNDMVSTLKTPYMPNIPLETIIYDAGEAYAHDEITLEQAVAQVNDKLSIYLGE